MWHKIESVEEKYGISKFSIYALITQEPDLRQYIKALEGVLQINDEGLEMLLALVKENGAKEESKEKSAVVDKVETTEDAEVEVLEENIFETEEAPAEASVGAAIVEEEAAVVEPTVPNQDFFEESPLKKELDFFSDIEEAADDESAVVTEITLPSENERDLATLIKALKEKMIIQNEQIRAVNEYMEVSRKILIQDEKIVTILESLTSEKK